MTQRNGLCASFVSMLDRNEPRVIANLRKRLSQDALPGWAAQSLACPPGRPRDVASNIEAARRAGVICLLCLDDAGEWNVVLMRRTLDGSPHSGQLAFPGGAEEPEDEGDLQRTALREFEEEVGVSLSSAQTLGPLSSLYIPPSDFLVQPFVAWSSGRLRFEIQEEEVAEVLTLPLFQFPKGPWPLQEVSVRGGRMRVPGWPCGGQILWGATAMMLAELRLLCELANFDSSFVSS